MRLDHQWVVCPNPEKIEDERTPETFDTEDQARTFLAFEWLEPERHERREKALRECEEFRAANPDKIPNFDQSLVLRSNRHRGWTGPYRIVGVNRRPSQPEAKPFDEFLPLGKVGDTHGSNLDEAVRRAYNGSNPKASFFLNAEWQIEKLVAYASRLSGHEFSGRRHKNFAEVAVQAVYDLDAGLRHFNPNPCTTTAARFFGSWQVWRHLAEFCEEGAKSKTGQTLTGVTPWRVTRETLEFIYKELWVYCNQFTEDAYQPRSAPLDDPNEAIKRLRSLRSTIESQDILIHQAMSADPRFVVEKATCRVIEELLAELKRNFPDLAVPFTPTTNPTTLRSQIRFARDKVHTRITELDEGQGNTVEAIQEPVARKTVMASPPATAPVPKRKPTRLRTTVLSLEAAAMMEAFIERSPLDQTEFATQAGTTDRTLRSFRKTGRVRRSIFDGIARAMGMTPQDLLAQGRKDTGK